MAVTTRAGIELRRRIKDRDFTQTSFGLTVGRTQSWVSNNLLADPAGTLRHLAYKDPERLDRILTALGWTIEQLNAATGLDIPVSPGEAEPNAEETFRMVIPGGLVMVPVMGMANGGKPRDYGIPVDLDLVRGDNTRAYQVEGDSMDTGTDDGIHDGDWVLVDVTQTEAVNGHVFLLEIIGDGMTVKRLRRVGNEWLFLSDNPIGESWNADQVQIVGEVYGRVNYRKVR